MAGGIGPLERGGRRRLRSRDGRGALEGGTRRRRALRRRPAHWSRRQQRWVPKGPCVRHAALRRRAGPAGQRAVGLASCPGRRQRGRRRRCSSQQQRRPAASAAGQRFQNFAPGGHVRFQHLCEQCVQHCKGPVWLPHVATQVGRGQSRDHERDLQRSPRELHGAVHGSVRELLVPETVGRVHAGSVAENHRGRLRQRRPDFVEHAWRPRCAETHRRRWQHAAHSSFRGSLGGCRRDVGKRRQRQSRRAAVLGGVAAGGPRLHLPGRRC
mmetsp:Transcript_124105/g.356421  ORF Transcript_124105/g.356421 Transcript_124105/m.356421 type:complete len:269 (+) Transcript_124105:1783-2589(+)